MATPKASPQGPAQGRYETLKGQRQPFLDRARECAKLTIPAMMPPDGHSGYAKLPTPWQALGARCVNHLGAKLLLSLFPPSAPFFKLGIDDFTMARITGQKDSRMRGQVEKALNKIERAVCQEVETSAMRPALNEVLKHLVASGNVLVYMPDEGPIRVFRLDRFVAKRDPMGHVLEIVAHEKVSEMELPESSKPLIASEKAKASTRNKKSGEDTYDLYTHVERTNDGWKVHQELCGQEVPRSFGTYPKDKCPWLPLRLTAIDNEDYGRGLVEEYLGDFKSLEALTKAITQGAAAAAKVLFLVKANGTTKAKAIAQAESGDVREGNAEDVTVLQSQKAIDLRVAKELRDSIREDVSYAFLLNSAIQRDGERVTAEEIRYMAQELETGLGGIYSNLSQELQLPFVTLLMTRLEKRGTLPALPRKYIKPEITTGLDAIGRGNDLSRLESFIKTLYAVDQAGELAKKYINGSELVKRVGVGSGIDMDGLVKDDATVAAEAQQSNMQQMIEKLGPQFITQAGAMARGGNTPT